MLKCDEVNDPRSCLNRAEEDEPIFVLRAHDELAPLVVLYWAQLASGLTHHGPSQIAEALEEAEAMRKWRTER
jgi:hypothetical protein